MTGVNEEAAFLTSLVKRITALERFASIDRSGATFDGSHVLTGDPTSPPAGLQVDQLLWDGDSTLTSSGTDWTAITYATGWANYGSGWQAGQYRRVGDEVQMRGLLNFNATGGSLTMTTLPVGFRPPANHLFICMGNTSVTDNEGIRFSVYNDGTVVLDNSNGYQGDSINGVNLAYVDISQIKFSVTA